MTRVWGPFVGLLDELSESPLPGARYAVDVVARHLQRFEVWAADERAHIEARTRADLRLELEREFLDWVPGLHGEARAAILRLIRGTDR